MVLPALPVNYSILGSIFSGAGTVMFLISISEASSGEIAIALFTTSIISLGCVACDCVESLLSLQADNSNNPTRLIHKSRMAFINTPYQFS